MITPNSTTPVIDYFSLWAMQMAPKAIITGNVFKENPCSERLQRLQTLPSDCLS